MITWAIVVHGGAGVIERKDLSPEQEAAYRAAMNRAIQAGGAVLSKGGSALDAIEATIQLMEDDPLFNAGRGAVFTAEGRNELDAAIMDGKTLAAGSVAGVTRTRHPISLARRVMEKSPHVMLISTGADTFSKEQGLEQVEPGWFYTERRWRALETFLKEKSLPIPPKPAGAHDGGTDAEPRARRRQEGHGRRRRARYERQHRGRHFDGRHDRQALGPRRRLADHRRGHVCIEHVVRSVSDGHWRVLHPTDGRTRDLLAGRAQGDEAAGGGG